MLVKQITSIIDRYGAYQTRISQLKSDLKTYRMTNMLETDDDKNTLALKMEIAKTQAELGRYLDEVV